MIKSLKMMNCLKEDELWLQYLYKTKSKNYNLSNVNSISEIDNHSVYRYVKRSLEILNQINDQEKLDSKVLFYVEETLKWMDVAKTGSKTVRKSWEKKGYDLFTHNIGSSAIYLETNHDEVVYQLIKTHGLIGQYLKGEITLDKNKPLYDLILEKKIEKQTLKKVLTILNRCIIEALPKDIYSKIEKDIDCVIEKIINNDIFEEVDIKKRMAKLNQGLIETDEKVLDQILKDKEEEQLKKVFEKLELWYYDSVLSNFKLEQQCKILLLIYPFIDNDTKHLSFEGFMHDLYLDYKDKKEINVYKARIIESYLNEISFDSLTSQNINPNPHIKPIIEKKGSTLIFSFKFSLQATKLIEFCEVAYISDTLYQKSVFMLYDLFGFRRDTYDRFYNEIDYLYTMNSSLMYKSIILDYIKGSNVLDVGPGGGALMDLILEKNPNLNVFGIDLSQNVIDTLNQKKKEENRKWNVIKGDALQIDQYFENKSIDTIIYSSIIHELYSYIPYEGKKFNKKTIAKTLTSAYQLLPVGGRIIIRDGIKTEPCNQYRIIEFQNEEDIEILKRYCHDFEGRKVTYERLTSNKVKMLVNDAMEFLYTYTWGENSYPLEVKEQFGYFTPTEYQEFVKEILPNSKIVVCHAFLQPGYEENLLPKISFYDEEGKNVSLPDSTCLLVIEKGE